MVSVILIQCFWIFILVMTCLPSSWEENILHHVLGWNWDGIHYNCKQAKVNYYTVAITFAT